MRLLFIGLSVCQVAGPEIARRFSLPTVLQVSCESLGPSNCFILLSPRTVASVARLGSEDHLLAPGLFVFKYAGRVFDAP